MSRGRAAEGGARERRPEAALAAWSRGSAFLPYAALGVGIISLGFSAIFVRWAAAPGLVSSFYRMAIGTAVLAWPYLRRVSRGTPRSNPGSRASRDAFRASLHRASPGLAWAVLGGLFFAIDLGLWATGVMLSGATNPTLLANTAPLWVGLGALLLFRERLRALFWIGLLVAMAGAGTVLGLDTLRAANLGVGSLLGLVAGIFYGAYLLAAQRGREDIDAVGYYWPATLTSTLVLLGVVIALEQPLTGYPLRFYWSFLGMGLINQTLGYLAVTYALGHLPASLVSPTLLGQPVATALLAWPLLGERLSWLQAAGGAAVLAGVYLIHTSRGKPRSG